MTAAILKQVNRVYKICLNQSCPQEYGYLPQTMKGLEQQASDVKHLKKNRHKSYLWSLCVQSNCPKNKLVFT